ncbi:hypothetical protein [uncultured Dokdonia sp.]|uniref:hypothetical protein n=1 Tax=uncultured Dokdonia sp. TaxID=575653 RepID=UPI00261F3E3A|nr:hypothetical protein [uncultured Dokdonia sp.]
MSTKFFNLSTVLPFLRSSPYIWKYLKIPLSRKLTKDKHFSIVIMGLSDDTK